MTTALSAGFTDPVGDAQACFRAVLDAMARPGRIHAVHGVVPPPTLCLSAAAVLLSLVDHETPLWLDPGASPARAWIAFHCGAPGASDPADAAFALALSLPDLTRFSAGTHEGPETSATVIVQIASLTDGSAYRLRGPGLKDSAILAPTGLPADFPAIWRRNQTRFPLGVDLILCAGDALAALPRGILIEEA